MNIGICIINHSLSLKLGTFGETFGCQSTAFHQAWWTNHFTAVLLINRGLPLARRASPTAVLGSHGDWIGDILHLPFFKTKVFQFAVFLRPRVCHKEFQTKMSTYTMFCGTDCNCNCNWLQSLFGFSRFSHDGQTKAEIAELLDAVALRSEAKVLRLRDWPVVRLCWHGTLGLWQHRLVRAPVRSAYIAAWKKSCNE